MKKINIYILSFVLLLSGASCSKFIEGYDVSPNKFKETTSEQQMLATILSNQFFHKADGMRLAMMWMNQATGAARQYAALDNWNNATSKDFEGPWSEVYLTLGRAALLEKMAEEEGNTVLRGVGKLYRAWAGGEAASLWGDVPFSQAGNIEIENPVYDSQQEVFNQVQDLLDEAIADFDSGNGMISQDKDICYGGALIKWRKLAYGLKARFYLHAGQYQQALEAAAQGPANTGFDMYAKFDSNDDAMWGQYNPTKQFQILRQGDYDASAAYALKLLKNANASEYSRYNSKTNEYGRSSYNYTGNTLNDATVFNGTGKFFGDMPLVTFGEMLLIRTEATLRDPSKTIDDALYFYNYYRQKLSAGNYMGGYAPGFYHDYEAADFEPGGIENEDGTLSPKQAFMRELFEERYVFFIGDYESYIDYARSFNDPDVPEYMKLRFDEDGNSMYENQPLRFIYPQVEEDANDNFPGMVGISVPLPMYQ